MIMQIQEMAKELTEILIRNEKRFLVLTETVEEMKMELRDINEQF